jgi:hypothetical protein
LSKFNLIITEVQLHIQSSSTACEKQFTCSVFFRAEILPIKIVSIYPVCTSKPYKYLIYNDMSLLSLVSHRKFKSLAYGRRFNCILFLKRISKSCIIWKHHLNKKSCAIWISFKWYIIYFIPICRLEVILKTVHAKSSNLEIRIIYI